MTFHLSQLTSAFSFNNDSMQWAGRSIALGTFPIAEAKRKAEEAKQLTKLWRTTKKVRPSREWVIDELERLHVRIVSSRRSADEMKGKDEKSVKKADSRARSGAARTKKSGSTADVYAKQYAVSEKRIRRVSYVKSDIDDDDEYDGDEGDAPSTKRARTLDAIDVGTTTATPAEPMTFTASLTNTPTTTGRRIMARRSSSLNLVASILNNTDFDVLFGEGPSANNLGTDTAATAIIRSESSRPTSLFNLPPTIENDPSDEDQDLDMMSDLSDSSTCSSSDRAAGCVSPIPTERKSSYAPSSTLLEMLSGSTTGAVAAPAPSGSDLYQDMSYFEKLKIHHMNLLEELSETTTLLDLYQQHIIENHQA